MRREQLSEPQSLASDDRPEEEANPGVIPRQRGSLSEFSCHSNYCLTMCFGLESPQSPPPDWTKGLLVHREDGDRTACWAISAKELRYATNAGGDWRITTVDSEGTTGFFTSIAVTDEGACHIAYTNLEHVLRHATDAGGSTMESTMWGTRRSEWTARDTCTSPMRHTTRSGRSRSSGMQPTALGSGGSKPTPGSPQRGEVLGLRRCDPAGVAQRATPPSERPTPGVENGVSGQRASTPLRTAGRTGARNRSGARPWSPESRSPPVPS